jgi:sugar-specific transcriptional regulator TrmB
LVLFSFEEAVKELASFGLTGNQARAYVALVQLRVASVRKIAQLSKIRREEIYRMMPKLERLGLVEKVLGKPIKYKSVPPKEALSILFKRERESAERKMAELAEKRRRLLKQLKSVRAERTVEEEPSFVLISDRDQALRKMATMLQKAKKEVLVLSSRYGLRLGYSYADAFREVLRKGVRARILLEINEVDAFTVKMLGEIEVFKDVVEVKHAGNLSSHIVIVDDAEVLFGTFFRPDAEKHIDLWTNSPAYVEAMKTFFERIWRDAVDIKSRIEYLQTGKPIERTEIIKGRDAIYKRLYAVNSRAKTDKLVTVNGSGVEIVIRDFTSTNMELKKRGVRIRYLTSITAQNLKAAEELSKQFEVKHTDKVPLRSLLTETEAMISWVPLEEKYDMAIYSNDAEFVCALWRMTEKIWDKAVDAQLRIDEIRKGEPIGRVSKPIIEYISKNKKQRS